MDASRRVGQAGEMASDLGRCGELMCTARWFHGADCGVVEESERIGLVLSTRELAKSCLAARLPGEPAHPPAPS
jgi:hypothetical protein